MKTPTSINHIEIVESSTGKHARIVGTGFKVRILAQMMVHNDVPMEWMLENYDLTPAQIHAALSYYYDHKEAFDQEIEEGKKLAAKLGAPTPESTK